jgi:hypothetical protein
VRLRPSRLALVALLALFAQFAASPLLAQRGVVIDVAVNPAAVKQDGPVVTATNLLADSSTRELLRNGFPTHIHYRLELWGNGRFLSSLESRAEWDAYVAYDPTSQAYNVVRESGDHRLHEDFGSFGSVSSAQGPLDRPFRAPLKPVRSGKYYYNLVIDVTTLTESDLDALQQWLKGSSAPKSNPAGVFRSGIGTLLSRVLGGDKRHYEQLSGTFSVP